ncbi:MAG: hypothetical protein ACP5L1_02445 [Caldivirga sp.]|uniref:hypothetical protein n=1 Tax=Caldivirga sp. TaxID=2080243 RepID=UPI003D10FC0D
MGKDRQLLLSSIKALGLANNAGLSSRRILELALVYAYNNRIDKRSLYSILRMIELNMATTVGRLRAIDDEEVGLNDVEVVEVSDEVVDNVERRVEDSYLGQRIMERLMPNE